MVTISFTEACNNVTPTFSHSLNKSCGMPRTLSLVNTSTGSDTLTSTFMWRVDNVEINRGIGKSDYSHLLTTPGTHRITLVVRDTSGCFDSSTTTFSFTSSSPQVRTAAGLSYSPLWQNCILSSNDPDTFQINLEININASNYTIVWGDGNTASGSQLNAPANIKHTYQNLGFYTFMLISANGSCTDTLYGTVVNERQPVAGLIGPPTGTNFGCVPLQVKFKNFSQNISPTTMFTWDMGDTVLNMPSTTYRDSFLHTYREYLCNQTVTMTAENACGTSTTTWNPINASDKDSASITPVNPTNCDLTQPFRFNNSSQDRYCVLPDAKRFYWDWGDGSNSGWINTVRQESHTYNARGSYTITLIDSNSCGFDTATHILIIDSLPVAIAQTTDTLGCSPLSATFVDMSIGNVVSRSWNFDDVSNNTSFDSVATHTFNNGGNYDVVLTISNACGISRDTVEVVVKQAAQASFTNIPSGCSPHQVNFNNTTISDFNSVTYSWDLGDNTTSSASNPPSKIYTTPGTYTVRLIASDSCGIDTFTNTFTVHSLPVASFDVPSSLVCSGASLFFNNTSTNSNFYTWDWGDGSSQTSTTQNNVYKTYNTTGTFYITLVSRNSTSCRDTITDSITVNPNPTAAFTEDSDSGCGPLLVNYTNNSLHGDSNPIDSLIFNWNFGDGNTSNTQDPTNNFAPSLIQDTSYNIKLVVTNVFGCRDSILKSVKVFPLPFVDYETDTTNGCSPLNIQYTNTSFPKDTGSINMMSFQWTFGNGNTSINTDENQTFIDSRTMDSIYTTKLVGISEHGCMDSISYNQTVFPFPTINFTMDTASGCSPFVVQFNNRSIPNDTGSINIMNFVWDFGNSDSAVLTNPSTTYTNNPRNDTNYYINLVGYSEHGCQSNYYDTVLMFPKPDVDFIADNYAGCEPFTVNFRDTSTHRFSSFWWLGTSTDTSSLFNPTHTYYSRPIYDSIVPVSHTVVSEHYCLGDTITKNITVYGDPISRFSIDQDTICFPDNKQMLNNSQAAIAYEWEFGINDTTSVFNPTHYFQESVNPTKDTSHLVRLIAFNEHGCPDTSYRTITVLPYPIADYSVDIQGGCSPVDVTFTNNSFNYDSVFWSFGDGAFSQMPSPTHRYINTGFSDTAFTAYLTVKTLTCIDTASLVIPVHRPTFAFYNFARVAPCDRGFFDFIDQSANATTYLWDFGDGTTSNQTNPRHLLNPSPWNDTAYLVKLITRTPNNCLDSMERLVPLPQRLRIDMLDTNYIVCVPGEVRFENRTEGAVNYFWNFGDGTGSVTRDAINIYRTPGIYTYKLTAYDPNGCADSIISTNTVNALKSPIARFDFTPPSNRMPNSTFDFTDRSIADAPLQYSWQFFDVDPTIGLSTNQNPSYTFSDSGWYDVELSVFNGSCYDTIVDSVRIEPPFPIPDFTVDSDSACAPLVVQFTNNSLHSWSYRWLFGDGNSSTEFEPTHTYTHGGTYSVTLFAAGPGGEEQLVKTDYIKVLLQPFTRFSLAPNIGFLPNAVFYTRNETTGAIEYDWSWIGPEGITAGSSNSFEPIITIEDTGYYAVQLISRSNEGCEDTLLKNSAIFVNPLGKLYVPNTFTPNGDLVNDGFKPTYLNIDTSDYYFEIFNRWGERIFITRNPQEAWLGTFKNELCQQGVYAWRISARFLSGDPINKEGVVHLLR